jgi:hypothetical protein
MWLATVALPEARGMMAAALVVSDPPDLLKG